MSNENKQSEWKKRECGALWLKESPSQKYFSGHVKVDDFGEEKLLKVVVFKNNYKEKDNHPDFRIYLATDAPQSKETETSSPQTQEMSTEEVL
tara:strand:+ start:1510 stop:1788 length:279 start_codon:yes stop_codon:yes gene_type:complete